MTNNDSDPDFYFPSSSPLPTLHPHPQNPRKKRSKLIKVEPNLVPSTPASTNNVATSGRVPKLRFGGKKPDPSAPKITRPCTECGKKFWSWKALFGHMRCHPERQWRGINPPPNYRKPSSPVHQGSPTQGLMTAEDHEVASCLVLLASSIEDDGGGATALIEAECGGNGGGGGNHQEEEGNCRFECSSCKKVFGSHQALGGHRASHKNVKGCFAIARSDNVICEQVVDQNCSETGDPKESSNINNVVGDSNKMLMVLGHKCSICLKVFSSGQALGGHKRCHWEKAEEASSSMNQQVNVVTAAANEVCGLDLNLPAPVEEEQSSSSYSSVLTSSAPTLDLRLGL